MINKTELRIGNLLKVDSFYWTVESIISNPFELYFAENDKYDHSLNAEPIPITEEWLSRFGFETFGKWFILKNLPKIQISISLYYNKCTIGSDEEYYVNIQHVHQLQNLYFALTGEELQLS